MSRRFLANEDGSPAAEFALSLPMMLALMFGGLEAGHFFWTQHKLVKAVRDGARYAARLDVNALCDASNNAIEDATIYADIRAVTSTGLPAAASAAPKVPDWDASDVDIDMRCGEFMSSGIYAQLGRAGPVVIVSSGAVAYPSLFEALGAITSDVTLSAESSAAVTGL